MDNLIPEGIMHNISPDPFGMITVGRSWVVGSEYRYGFNGKESDNQTYGDGNVYDYGSRIYNPQIALWLSLDFLARKYASTSPYIYTLNSPICFKDPDGNDVVYYDSKGTEVNRIVSTERFEAYVDLNNDGNYLNAPMPNIILGREDPIYQKFDYIIAAQTFIFNNGGMENTTTANGIHLDGVLPCKLSPTLVKAIILQETVMGLAEGDYGQNGDSDIMQANVKTTGVNGVIESDWAPFKANLGLTEGGSATPEQSVYAGIRILYMKGLQLTDAKYSELDKNDKNYLTEESTVVWRGNDLNSWWYAVENYNVSIDEYNQNVYKSWNNSKFTKDAKYYVEQPKKVE